MMVLHFHSTYFDGIAHFRDLGDQNVQIGRTLKMGRFLLD